jgi:hypothetical protein
MNTVYRGLVEHFGKDLGTRIYGCAMLFEVYEEQGIEVAVRYTIGALKRMRQQGTRKVSWADAVDRLEHEQVESRHYSLGSALSRDVKRIEDWNKQSTAEHKAAQYVIQAIEAEQDRYNRAPEEQLAVKAWVEAYRASLSTRKANYLDNVVAHWKKGEEATRRVKKTIVMRYAPVGVGFDAFVEVLAKYA